MAHGSSDCRAFTSGYRFDLTEHYRDDMNQAWVLTSAAAHVPTEPGDFTQRIGRRHSDLHYRNQFECIPYSTPFRPPRVTPHPVVQGSQTAVVVGPPARRSYVDKYGRVKVQFHWDREGKKDENSSCWIRVAQNWAGKRWGAMFIPRIGQEVIVDFLEGDPDQPIITGPRLQRRADAALYPAGRKDQEHDKELFLARVAADLMNCALRTRRVANRFLSTRKRISTNG